MKTIAMVVEAAGGGAGTHVADLARELLWRGHTVHMLYSTARADAKFRKALAAMKEVPCFHCEVIDIRRDLSWTDLNAVVQLARYFRRRGPFDVVHAHSTKAGLVGRIAAALCGFPAVYTPHTMLTWNHTISAVRRNSAIVLERALARITHTIIAVSEEEGKHILSIGISRDRIAVVLNGIDASRYRSMDISRNTSRARYGLSDHNACIGFVGRLVREKHPDMMLRAFAGVAKQDSGCRLMIAGDGPLRAECETLAHRLGIDRQIIWCGEIDASKVFPAFDIFALSSCVESLPYVVMEAMAAGLPIVATDVGGLRQLVQDGVCGLLVKAGDISAFQDALSILVKDSRLRMEMGVESAKIVEQFSISSMVDEIERVYLRTNNSMNEAASCLKKLPDIIDGFIKGAGPEM